MRFTYETENNDSINFIGLTIKHETINNMHNYETSVYKKPTSTALFTNFNSFTPLAYRVSVFKCLIFRAFQLCSNWKLCHTEVVSLKERILGVSWTGRISWIGNCCWAVFLCCSSFLFIFLLKSFIIYIYLLLLLIICFVNDLVLSLRII